MNIWMKVTNDIYELPIAVADSAEELAEIVGTSKNAIYSAICHAKTREGASSYVKAVVSQEEYYDREM